jgi:hypothetical protein
MWQVRQGRADGVARAWLRFEQWPGQPKIPELKFAIFWHAAVMLSQTLKGHLLLTCRFVQAAVHRARTIAMLASTDMPYACTK